MLTDIQMLISIDVVKLKRSLTWKIRCVFILGYRECVKDIDVNARLCELVCLRP